MIFAFLDEFGHVGPFVSRVHARFNESPVFGLGGILLPEPAVRSFSGWFLRLKTHLLKFEIEKSGKMPYEWEKKGTSLFTAKSIEKYPEIRTAAFRLISKIRKYEGQIFFYGREKYQSPEVANANGLYRTVFAHAIRRIDQFCDGRDTNFVIVVDEHSARKELLDTAAKTMFGAQPARRLISPPFEVESYVNQAIQAADWIAAILGHLWAYELEPAQFLNYAPYRKYFWDRIHQTVTHSTVLRKARAGSSEAPTPETVLALAFARAVTESHEE